MYGWLCIGSTEGRGDGVAFYLSSGEAGDAGRLLILSLWPYVEGKRHISRSECVALNEMAEEIASTLNQ